MKNIFTTTRPNNIDWNIWIKRWDQMQERYLVERSERFNQIVKIVKATQPIDSKILDIGCGIGSLANRLLKEIPNATLHCVDIDPSILWMAESLKEKYKDHIQIYQLDLRSTSWIDNFTLPFNAVVSATALHWLNLKQLTVLYKNIHSLLNLGGIFLNADHVGSESKLVQEYWEDSRDTQRNSLNHAKGSDWDSFWDEYSNAINIDIKALHQNLFKDRESGPEEGLPLSWHFDELRKNGFSIVECFWRCDCDAVYGGIK